MATITVTNSATLIAALASVVAGDRIECVPSVTAYMDVATPYVIEGKNDITITRAGGDPAFTALPGTTTTVRCRRNHDVRLPNIIVRNCDRITFKNLHFHCSFWCDTTTGGRWSDSSLWGTGAGDTSSARYFIGLDYGAGNVHANLRPRFEQCEFSWGYGPTQAPFDPRSRPDASIGNPLGAIYPEYESGTFANAGSVGWNLAPKPWWVNLGWGNGVAYNTIGNGPGVATTAPGKSPIQLVDCYLHDVARGILISHTREKLVVDGNWAERLYGDFLSGGTGGTAAFDNTYGVQFTRNLVIDFFADYRDSLNAHGDLWQHFNGYIRPGADFNRIRGIRAERNLYYQGHGTRDGVQGWFLMGGIPGGGNNEVKYVMPIIRDNLQVDGSNTKGILINGWEGGLIENNAFLHRRDGARAAFTTIGFSRPATALPGTANHYAGTARLRNNILDTLSAEPSARSEGDLAVNRYAAVSQNDLFANAQAADNAGAAGYLASFVRKPAYAAKGQRWLDLDALFNAPLSTANIETWISWPTSTGNTVLQTVTSGYEFIHGPIGDTVTVSVNLGEFEVADDFGNIVRAWGNAPFVANCIEHRVRVRHVGAGTPITPTTQRVTLTHASQGARDFIFTSITKSNNVPAEVGLNSVSPFSRIPRTAATGLVGVANGGEFSFILDFYRTAGGFTQPLIVADVNGNKLRISDNAGSLEATIRNPAGAALWTGNPLLNAAFPVNTWVRICLAVDLIGNRQILYKDELKRSINPTRDPNNGLFALSGFNYGVFGYNAGHQGRFRRIGFTNRFVDFDDPAILARAAELDWGGADGSGIDGTAWKIYVLAKKALLDAGNANRGDGGAFAAPVGAVTQLIGDPALWPIPLGLFATLLTPNPVAGQPVQVLVRPLGANVAMNVTPVLNGAPGAPVPYVKNAHLLGLGGQVFTMQAAAGPNTISFTNDAGYANPAQINFNGSIPTSRRRKRGLGNALDRGLAL